MTDVDLALRFFLQLVILLAACRFVGFLGRRLGQTQVVSEMIAGVLLGPSLLGVVAPQLQEWLFPKTAMVGPVGQEISIRHPSMGILYVVSQVGLVLYMFIVGMEFDLDLLKKRATSAVAVSLAGIITPILLGGLAGLWLHGRTGFFGANVSPWSGAFFLGAAMAITAFPMLARIIYEAGISRTSMGLLALGAAATDDAVAWGLLAIVLSSVHGDSRYALFAIGGGAIYAIAVLGGFSRLMKKLEDWRQKERQLTTPMFAIVLLLLFTGAYTTDAIGIYAVFGAFIVGAAMPKGDLAADIRRNLDKVVSTLLLPLYFVYSGLNTKISLIDSLALWVVTGLLVVVAILAKGLACTVMAKAAGETWSSAMKIGTLMNARGLIELIILNIGLQNGVITQTLFTMMVIMAIVTTLIASPLFQYLDRRSPELSGTGLSNAAKTA